mgnify:CR=1 FL=1
MHGGDAGSFFLWMKGVDWRASALACEFILSLDLGRGEERAEDAVVPKPSPSPYTPARAEREAHEATHLPCRNWCSVCEQGRADNPQHRRRPPSAEGDRRLPEVHIDYAFLRRSGEEELAKLVILKALPSRAARTDR